MSTSAFGVEISKAGTGRPAKIMRRILNPPKETSAAYRVTRNATSGVTDEATKAVKAVRGEAEGATQNITEAMSDAGKALETNVNNTLDTAGKKLPRVGLKTGLAVGGGLSVPASATYIASKDINRRLARRENSKGNGAVIKSAFDVDHDISKLSLATPIKAVKSAFTSSPTVKNVMAKPKVQEFGAKVGGSNVGRGFLSQMKTQGSAIPKPAQQFADSAPKGIRGTTGVGAAKAVKHVTDNPVAYKAGAAGAVGGGYVAHKFGKSSAFVPNASAFGVDHEMSKSIGSVFRSFTRTRKPPINAPAPVGTPTKGPGIPGEPLAEKTKRAGSSFMSGARSGAAARTANKAQAKNMASIGSENPTGAANLITSNERTAARAGMNTQQKIGEHVTYNRAKYGVAAGGAGLFSANTIGRQQQKRKGY